MPGSKIAQVKMQHNVGVIVGRPSENIRGIKGGKTAQLFDLPLKLRAAGPINDRYP
jgi:hypothetical protein